MNTTFATALGDRGRLVVPAELRAKQKWEQGTPLLLIETDGGVVLASQAQAKQLVRAQLAGRSLVDELIADRRAAAQQEEPS
ncbi:MAG: AbrB/MazE/SpoVT family DNA-binding domain-containing protein [Actinobacteria bacterium]|nr:AbrB/MazE/SpoVT family DNA-binding domain-containing protein [Actinomycetota bacterium]